MPIPVPGKAARRAAAAAFVLLAAAALPLAGADPASAANTARPGAPGVPARYLTQHLAWQPCAAGALECAAMAVPRDWHHPDRGPALTVEVSRHRATDPAARRGVLMMAAGGPGASGLKRPAGLATYAPALAAAYDIVSFDQRGVGSSTKVTCADQPAVDAYFSGDKRDRSPEAIRTTFARARAFVRECERRSGDLLPYLTTDQAVHDMDLYRSLLGADTLSYYGPSYATYLGAAYATEFPHRVARMVLDSNIDYTGTWQSFMEGQPFSFQRRFEEDFLPWLARHDDVYHQGRTPSRAKASYERLRAALRDAPLVLDGTALTPDQLDTLTSNALYQADPGFPRLAAALTVLEHPDTAPPAAKQQLAKAMAHPMDAAFVADFFSVVCNDTPWNRSADYWIARSARDTREHPLVGARSLAYSAVCAAWPRSAAPRIEVTGRGLPPLLLVNSTHDPATYYEGALRDHRALPGSRLITVAGGGDHGQFQNRNACVDGFVEDYLLDEAVPPADTTCAANPLPAPAAPASPGPR
ncbi:alpha/beta hydrolase [Streptomyces sp. RS10V-4]|uniref:alpha/beta hydrolase n=1 Tax=Streptomyces rhizoryzae TaxID=2932493 RepID=UPI0020069F49|nr:alpha/beta hydrolase [Streptomyces rhizoryzae]MCK7624951.1 alpha/beta hydrolase [Streptomyces rhizoryzae]